MIKNISNSINIHSETCIKDFLKQAPYIDAQKFIKDLCNDLNSQSYKVEAEILSFKLQAAGSNEITTNI